MIDSVRLDRTEQTMKKWIRSKIIRIGKNKKERERMKSMERKNWSIGRFGSRLLSLLSREKSPFLFNCENNCKQHRAHNTESKSENKFSHTCSRTSHVAAHVDRCNDEGGQTSWIFVRSSYSASSLVLLSDLHRIFCEWERIKWILREKFFDPVYK